MVEPLYGQINLESYLAKSAYDRIKAKFYIYEKLYTTEFETFKSLQLESGYGKRSHFEQVNLLLEQGLIENIPITYGDFENGKNEETVNWLGTLYGEYQRLGKLHEQIDTHESVNAVMRMGFVIQQVKERMNAEIMSKKLSLKISPVSSMTGFTDLITSPTKTNILTILLDRMPMPDQSVLLADIIQYRDEESNRKNFLKLKAWINKMGHSGYTKEELQEEIEYLMNEYEDALKSAHIKMTNARLEFAIKVVPETIENIIKLNWSKIPDPFFKLRTEKLALLETERTAKGNELAYIINGLKNSY